MPGYALMSLVLVYHVSDNKQVFMVREACKQDI